MLEVLETYAAYLFFILFTLLQGYSQWKADMTRVIKQENDIEEMPLWGMPRPSEFTEVISDTAVITNEPKPVDVEVEYEKSHLTNDQQAFVSELINSININCMDSNDDDDLITMKDWEENTEIKVAPRFSSTATARIEDYELGEQVWVVEVVGEEQNYLHISDGTAREWINIEQFNCSDEISKGDILSLLVERHNDRRITVKSIEILQKVSHDFSIPDEEYENEYAYSAYNII